jgi:hypothetical protein
VAVVMDQEEGGVVVIMVVVAVHLQILDGVVVVGRLILIMNKLPL